ncbi:MAG: prepilin-type N-terminal cleavage/methylation domain-containing protein [Porticoccaceae bacterium]|nr:prepilin-type N-terminal cleavage/methylation domain-containing protein [Porticoccaceae bacterium]
MKGFTLIELLVTMSLLSMVILIGSSAVGFFSERWQGQLGNFDIRMRNAQTIMLVQDVLASLIPYVAYGPDGKPFIYFEGNRNGFVAVSSMSLYSHNDFAVVRLSIKENLDLTYDVLYEEWPMSDSVLVSTHQQLEFSEPLVLFSSITNPRFEYLGWSSIKSRTSISAENISPPPSWLDNYNGLLAWFSPIKVRFGFMSLESDYSIIATLASERPGLLSRYKANQTFAADKPKIAPVTEITGSEVPTYEDCDC